MSLLRFSRGGRQSFFWIVVVVTTLLGAGGFLLINGIAGSLTSSAAPVAITLIAGGTLAAAVPTVLLQIAILSVWQAWRGGFSLAILFGSAGLASILPLAFLILAPGQSILAYLLWLAGVVALVIATFVARLAGVIRPDLIGSPT